MSGHWWRAYDEAVDNAKLLLLSDRQHRAWFNLMCLSSANDGALPDMKIMALKLRMSPAKVEALLTELRGARLLDEIEGGKLVPHDWSERQYKSDVSTSRVKRFRERKRNVSETHQTTDTENRKDDAPDGAKIAFESGRIRLNAKNLSQWKSAFLNLDVEAELLGLSDWAEKQGNNWFVAVSGALAKRNREIGIRQKQQSGPRASLAERPYTEFIT